MRLKFLGTGGGRFTMIEQLRRTGGMYLEEEDFSMCIDPGPGALVHARREKIELEELDAVLVTHAHLDHCNDMNVLVEAMTSGGKEESGTLIASRSVVDGAEVTEKYTSGEGVYGDTIEAPLDPFHRGPLEEIIVMEDGSEFDLGPFEVECMETEHSDPRTIAFTLEGRKKIGFVTDTEMFPGLIEFFQGCDFLIINLMRPREKEWKGHLNTEDAARILNEVEPEFAVLQHFGAALIYGSVKGEEKWLEENTDVEFVMARDGMELDFRKPESGLEKFL